MLRSLILHVGCDMRVSVQREGSIRVPENSRQGLGIYTACNCVCRKGMPQIMKTNRRKICFFKDSSTNRYFYMKEDYLGEAMYHNVKNNVNKVIGAVTTIATGAKIGNVPGAVIAAVGVAANEGISIFNKYASLENQKIGRASCRERV